MSGPHASATGASSGSAGSPPGQRYPASRMPAWEAAAAIVFGALSVPTLVLFFSGAPGMLGATAAFLAGLTRGCTPADGAPRVFGIVGLVFAILNMLVTILGVTIAWLAVAPAPARSRRS